MDIHINFLFTFKNSNRPPWLPDNTRDKDEIQKDRIFCSAAPEKIQNIGIITNILEGNDNRLVNCSILIWNGQPISYYRKSTYCREKDKLIISSAADGSLAAGDYKYEFGDFKDHIVPGLQGEYSTMAQQLIDGKILTSRICYDLNEPYELPEGNLLIINSNGIPSFRGWRPRLSNDVFCIIADSPELFSPYPFVTKEEYYENYKTDNCYEDGNVISYMYSEFGRWKKHEQ